MQVAELERQSRVEKMMLRGVTSPLSIAVAFGVHAITAKKMMVAVRDMWQETNASECEHLRVKREKQLEHIYFTALQSFERSTIGPAKKETITCKACAGEGTEEDMPEVYIECKPCAGRGTIDIESQLNSVTPGDPAFLKIAKDTVIELMKMDGMYKGDTAKAGARSMQMTSRQVDGELRVRIDEFYAEADPEVIMRAMRLLDDIESKKRKKAVRVIDAAVVPKISD